MKRKSPFEDMCFVAIRLKCRGKCKRKMQGIKMTDIGDINKNEDGKGGSNLGKRDSKIQTKNSYNVLLLGVLEVGKKTQK